jgi:hypothetical protein
MCPTTICSVGVAAEDTGSRKPQHMQAGFAA